MKKNILLGFIGFVLVLSYQNCAEDFDINQVTNKSSLPGIPGQPTNPTEPEVKDFAFNIYLNSTSVPQDGEIIAEINTSIDKRSVNISWQAKCPEDTSASPAGSNSCRDSYISCAKLVCSETGNATISAKIIHEGKEVQSIEKTIRITDLSKVTAPPRIETTSSSIKEKTQFSLRMEYPSTVSATEKQDASILWSLPTGCTTSDLSSQNLSVVCKEPGAHLFGVSYETRKHTGSVSQKIGVNGGISIYAGSVKVGKITHISILHKAPLGTNITWTTSSNDCSFKNVRRAGNQYTGELKCDRIPNNNSGKVRINGHVNLGNYVLSGQSPLMTVGKASLSLSIANIQAAALFAEIPIPLNASVSGNITNKPLTYNWKVNSGSGCIIANRSSIITTMTCSKKVNAIVTFEAYNSDSMGSRSKTIRVAEPLNVEMKNCSWSSYSSYDNVAHQYCPINKVLTGVRSVFSASKEDRIFSMNCCEMQIGNDKLTTSSTYSTGTYSNPYISSWDTGASLNCPSGKVRTATMSKHSNKKEDRIFGFRCAAVKHKTTQMKLVNCAVPTHPTYGQYVNNWRSSYTFNCPANKVIAKEYSYHSNSQEDRKFKYTCCEMKKP